MAGKDRKRATGAVAVPFGFMASGCLLQQQPTPTTIPEPAHRVWVCGEDTTPVAMDRRCVSGRVRQGSWV